MQNRGLVNKIKTIFQKKQVSLSNYDSWSKFSYSFLKDHKFLDNIEGWVYLSASYIGEYFASKDVQFHMLKSNEWVRDDDSQIINDLNHFNDYQTLYEARTITAMQLVIAGNSFWYIDKTNPRKWEFFILNPEKVSMSYAKGSGLPVGYSYQNTNGSSENIDYEDILHFRIPNPRDWVWGQSVLQTSSFFYNTWEEYAQYGYNKIKNIDKPRGVLSIEGTPDEAEMLKRQMDSNFKGTKNAGKTAVINKDIKFTSWDVSNNDLEYVTMMERLRDDMLSMFKIPKDLVVGNGTYENSSEAQRIFQTFNILPKLKLESDVFNSQLLPRYYPDSDKYKFTFEDPVQKDREQVRKDVNLLWKDGLIDRARALTIMGEETKHSDVGTYYYDLDLRKTPDDTKIEKEKSLKKKSINKADLKKKYLDLNLSAEEKFLPIVQKFFSDQEKRVFPDLSTVKLSKKELHPNEDSLAVEVFLPIYEDLATSFNSVANSELVTTKPLSSTYKNNIQNTIADSVTRINNTTKQKLRNVLSQAVIDNLSERQTRQLVIDTFDEFIHGKANIEKLKKLGVYEARSKLNIDNQIVKASQNRFNQMLENISNNLKGDKQKEALQALVNTTDYSDPISVQTEKLVKSLYGVEKSESIAPHRASTITITETNKLKNSAMRDRYENDETVSEMQWLTAGDGYVRNAHSYADGQKRKKGEDFRVDGESLSYPSDPKGSAKNTINCRCTLTPVI